MNDEKEYFYNYLVKVLSISKIGLTFSKDPYAMENYKEVQTLTNSALEKFEEISFQRPSFFKRDIYPTPNVSCRTIISNSKGQILLVKEQVDGGYTFPGGWCDLYDSPKQAAIRECLEEAGVEVEIESVVAILNRTPFKQPTFVPEYAIFFKGTLKKDFHTHDHEILNVAFFDVDNLPVLSKKITLEEIQKVLDAYKNGVTICD